MSDHHLKERDHEVIEPLVELLNRGIYDQEEKENCQSEEWSIRFSAVCNSLLLQYCCSLQELVGLALTLVLESKLTYCTCTTTLATAIPESDDKCRQV